MGDELVAADAIKRERVLIDALPYLDNEYEDPQVQAQVSGGWVSGWVGGWVGVDALPARLPYLYPPVLFRCGRVWACVSLVWLHVLALIESEMSGPLSRNYLAHFHIHTHSHLHPPAQPLPSLVWFSGACPD